MNGTGNDQDISAKSVPVWQPIGTAPEHEEVWTKIDDEHGERNVAKLTRHTRLWYTHPTNGMYVYYTPTHWRRP